MSTRTKILITIILAAAWVFWLDFISTPAPATTNGNETTVVYLENLYKTFNEQYFANKLTKTPVIDLRESFSDEPTYMASTMCNDGATVCTLKFNFRYIAAPRVADFTMLHEMCHVKVWDKEVDSKGYQIFHGRNWRSCMLQLDAEGAFREIIIDNYQEEVTSLVAH